MHRTFQEYPKGLCKGGVHGTWRVVMDAQSEQQARKSGFASLHEEPKPRRKPGPKPKQS